MADNEEKWMRILEVHFSSGGRRLAAWSNSNSLLSDAHSHSLITASPGEEGQPSQPASTNLYYHRFIASFLRPSPSLERGSNQMQASLRVQ
jgi:hypothetical protein